MNDPVVFIPQFVLTPSILTYISQIEAAKAVIENSPLLPLYERRFKSEATIRQVHFSTSIEGNYLQMDEVRKILVPTEDSISSITSQTGDEVVARQRDVQEVINYRDLVEFIASTVSKSSGDFVLDEEIIFKMHKILLRNIMDGSAGRYRVGVASTVNFATGEKLYPYEKVDNIPQKVAELIEWYNRSKHDQLHPVIKAGILHLELVRIHPFEEGNGRLARALATLSLSMDGYDVNHFFCLDEYYDSNAQDYYHHLGEGFTDPTIWIEYFALGMSIEFNRIKERVVKISKDAKIREHVGQQFITERQEKIIYWINTYGYFRNQDFSALFPDLSDDTVLRELKGLMDARVILKKGKTKSARYELI